MTKSERNRLSLVTPNSGALKGVCGLLAASVLGVSHATPAEKLAQSFTPEQNYQLAMEARSSRDYAEMMDSMRKAALQGSVPAQEMLAGILLTGPAIFESEVQADPCEALTWIGMALEKGSVVARHQEVLVLTLFSAAEVKKACGPGLNR